MQCLIDLANLKKHIANAQLQHIALPLFTCAFAATTLFYPTATLHAEAPPSYEIIVGLSLPVTRHENFL